MTILLVDDKAENLYLLEKLLQGNGYKTVSAANGAEALAVASKNPPDMVVSDILMPVMDGFTLCREWRKNRTLDQVPFVFYTATYTDPKDEELALSLGADRFITKPQGPGDFLKAIQETLHAKARIHERRVAPQTPEEEVFLKEYNEALVRKLGDKMTQMEEAKKTLREQKVALEREIEDRKAAEEALALFSHTFQSINECISITDSQNNILFVNQAFLTTYGYAREELVGQPADILKVDVTHGRDHILQETLSGGWRGELLNRKKDGTVFPVSLSTSVVYDEKKQPVALVGVATDISDRKRMEDALATNEELYRTVFENTGTATVLIEENTIISLANAEYEKLSQYSRGEIEGKKSWTEFVVQEDLDHMRAQHFLRREDREAAKNQYEFRFVRKDGNVRNVLLTVDIIPGTGKSVASLLDITGRKQAEEKLRDSEERYRRITEAITDYMYTVRIRGGEATETTHGPGCVGVTGYTPEELAADPYLWFRMVAPEDRRAVQDQARKVLTKEGVPELEHRILRKDGTQRWVKNSLVPRYDAEGTLQAYDGLVQDITERKRIERALRESEEKFSKIFHNAPVLILISDLATGTCLDVNEEALRVFGFSREEVIGSKLFEIGAITAENRATIVARLQSHGRIDGMEMGFRARDGHTIVGLIKGERISISGRDCILAAMVDITELKVVEEELRKSEERYRQITKCVPDLIWTMDLSGRFTYGNSAIERTHGWTVEEFLKLTFRDTNTPQQAAISAAMIEEELAKALSSGYDHSKILTIESHELRKDGSTFWAEVSAAFLWSDDGKPAGIIGITRDITERRRTETKILEQARLLDVARDAIIVRDMDDKLLYMNHAAEQLYGWTFEELRGFPSSIYVAESDRKKFQQEIEGFLEKGGWEGELRQKTKDGRELFILTRWTLVRDEAGKPAARLIINRDITGQRKLEAQLRHAQRLESLGTLAGGIAHDLNNVLAPITMSLALLDRKITDPGLRRHIATLETSAQRGSDIIKQVLLFARGSEKDFAPQQLRYIIREIGMIIQETFPRSIELHMDVAKDLRYVMGDATQLHQVLMNLSVNARDAMPQGGRLTITASDVSLDEMDAGHHAGAKAGEYVLLSIADTGTGMVKEIQERIFEPFFTTKDMGKGTGLGLSTAYAIVKDHNGFIHLESDIGKGTTFKIYLPALRGSEVSEPAQQTKPVFSGHGELVLVVDDEQAVLEITKEILEGNGYNVLIANNGAEAVSLFSSAAPGSIHLILSDVNMPGMDGPTAIKAIRGLDPRVKVIITSGLVADLDPVNMEKMNIQGYLVKPYTTDRMLTALHDVLAAG